jgi:hypothetical protein
MVLKEALDGANGISYWRSCTYKISISRIGASRQLVITRIALLESLLGEISHGKGSMSEKSV